MLFNSLPFLLFFIVFFGFYWVTPPKYRLWLIILGSTVFYAYWNYFYVLLPHGLTILAYLGAIWVGNGVNTIRKARLATVITLLLLPLILIKYSSFLYNDIIVQVFNLKEYRFTVSLPLSLSFVTFTLLAYVIDIYNNRFQVERRLSMLMGLVLFFPHLIAGPILRPHDLLPQLSKPISIQRYFLTRALFGMVLFSIGLLKKVVFADQLAGCIDPVYAGTGSFSSLDYLLAIYGFSAQLYCDFSGYTDMAIGLAIILGIRLPNNFEQPYVSLSLVEFWRRWHITLSYWLRDYLYISLGGGKGRYNRQVVNILITMGLGGLWHGANWTFLIWGLLHALGIAWVHGIRKLKLMYPLITLPRWVLVLITFHFVAFAWIFFRAPDMATAARVITGVFSLTAGDSALFLNSNVFYLGLLLIFFVTHRFDGHKKIRRALSHVPLSMIWGMMIMIWILAFLFSTESARNFIYFDF